MQKDLFAPVPEFLAAFNNILESGFFEKIEFNTGCKMMEGKIHSFFINVVGCVPNNKKYGSDGCGAIIDPNAIIASSRKLAAQKKVKDITTRIETKDWLLWDATGKNVVGSKGKRTELFLCVTFKT